MTIANAANPASVAIEPTLLALIPVITVVLTIVAGLVGAWIQSRREHTRWLREERLAAYIAFLTVVYDLENEARSLKTSVADLGKFSKVAQELAAKKAAATTDEERAAVERERKKAASQIGILNNAVEDQQARMKRLRESHVERSVRFGLLGPAFVQDASRAQDAAPLASAESAAAILELESAMRKALNVRD